VAYGMRWNGNLVKGFSSPPRLPSTHR